MITVKDVEKLAELSRIKLSPEEKEKMTEEIGSILGYIDQIKEVSTSVEGNIPGDQINVMREDEAKNIPGEFTKDILANAPSKQGDYFEVKKILS